MNLKHFVVCILLATTVLPLAAQDNGATLPPNYRRIKKEVKRADGPYCYDSLLVRFYRCDTSLTVDDLRCLYFGGEELWLYKSFHHYWQLKGRFGRHQGKVNDAWWQYQMLETAVWSTGNGSKRKPLHVRGADDASFIIASSPHGYMVKRTYVHCHYLLLRYVAQEEGDSDVWFYIRR